MPRSAAVDGFVLDYTDEGPRDAPAVVLLHGWPGGARDYRDVVPLLSDLRTVVPDLRGFGDSDRHLRDPATAYGAAAQARSVAGLVTELGLDRPVVAGYDVGSRVAQQLARDRPDQVGALALAPPLPGAGARVLEPDRVREYWYQSFHQLPVCVELVDGDRRRVREYLRHFWDHWSGPDHELDADEFETLVEGYARPGAFEASINWYRAGSGTLALANTEQAPSPDDRLDVPTIVLWPEHDPLFPRAWSDRLDEWFADVELRYADGVGHFTPLEAPALFADAVRAALAQS